MNIENINKLILHLESLSDDQFDWSIWSNECGTTCCVAGWACVLFNENFVRDNKGRLNHIYWLWQEKASQILGLTNEQENLLFLPLGEEITSDIKKGTYLSGLDLEYIQRYEELYFEHDWQLNDIEGDIQFIIKSIGLENIDKLDHDPKLMAKLIRAYVEKWQKEELENKADGAMAETASN